MNRAVCSLNMIFRQVRDDMIHGINYQSEVSVVEEPISAAFDSCCIDGIDTGERFLNRHPATQGQHLAPNFFTSLNQ